MSLHAVHSRVSARSTTLLSAYAENVSYTNASWLAAVGQPLWPARRGGERACPSFRRCEARSYQEGGLLDTRVLGVPIVPPPTPGGLITPPILVPPDGDFLSVTGREYSFAGHGGGTFALGPRDSMSLSSGVEHVVFHSGTVRTAYTTIPASLAYDRQLVRERPSARASLRRTPNMTGRPASA